MAADLLYDTPSIIATITMIVVINSYHSYYSYYTRLPLVALLAGADGGVEDDQVLELRCFRVLCVVFVCLGYCCSLFMVCWSWSSATRSFWGEQISR